MSCSPKTPGYAQSTISFRRHHNLENELHEKLTNKSKVPEKSPGGSSKDENGKALPLENSSQKDGKRKLSLGTQNGANEFEVGEDKENVDPKKGESYFQNPVLKSREAIIEGGRKGISLSFEKLPCEVSRKRSSIQRVVEHAFEAEDTEWAIPKAYLKNLFKGDVVSAEEWAQLVDIITNLCEAVSISHKEETRGLTELNEELIKELKYRHRVSKNAEIELKKAEKCFKDNKFEEGSNCVTETRQMLEFWDKDTWGRSKSHSK